MQYMNNEKMLYLLVVVQSKHSVVVAENIRFYQIIRDSEKGFDA